MKSKFTRTSHTCPQDTLRPKNSWSWTYESTQNTLKDSSKHAIPTIIPTIPRATSSLEKKSRLAWTHSCQNAFMPPLPPINQFSKNLNTWPPNQPPPLPTILLYESNPTPIATHHHISQTHQPIIPLLNQNSTIESILMRNLEVIQKNHRLDGIRQETIYSNHLPIFLYPKIPHFPGSYTSWSSFLSLEAGKKVKNATEWKLSLHLPVDHSQCSSNW